MDNYTVLHLHSMLSNGTTNIDSVTNYKDYITRAKELGMKALCFTEHGNIFSWLHKKEDIEAAGMKYIHGVEAYITESLDEKVRDNYHCVLIAKNYDGFLELNTLVSKSFNRAEVKVIDDNVRFYYMPRITFDELINTSDNIIVTSACLGGIIHNGNDLLVDRFLSFMRENKHRCYLELQHHMVQEQIDYNRRLIAIHEEMGIPLTIGTDTHCLNEEHSKGREVLQKSKKVFFKEEEKWDFIFRSFDELIKCYKEQNSVDMKYVYEGLENTNKIAESIEEFSIDRSYKYPKLWENPLELLKSKINKGIIDRGVDKYPNYQEYLDRIEMELEAYIHNGAVDFMLLMEDIIDWCKRNDIEVGYGRGSVNGSVVAWLLGITEMDSIKHKLNFQRFMNVERVSLSDIDTDFPPSKIEDVKQYIFNRAGLYCCDIVTFNTIADKGAIRDVVRGMMYANIPLIINNRNVMLDEKTYMKMTDEIIAAFNENPEDAYAKYKNVFEFVDLLKGVVVSVGSHPCGAVVAPFSVTDSIGTFTTSTSSYPISQLNMKEIDSLNFVKLDLLRLDTIEIINNACKLAGIERVTPDNLDISDEKVWKSIRDDTTQIFQWEGNTGDSYIKKLMSDQNIDNFRKMFPDMDYGELMMMLLSIGNSAIRPAGASYRDDLANGVIRKTGSKPIDDFLSSTFGYLVFQCQIIDFLHSYCGFTMGEADIVRRGFAKKTGTERYIPIIKNGGFINENHHVGGYIKTMKEKYGIDEEKSEEDIVAFIQVIEDASRYLFSLNHSQPYSYEGYASGWLRTYYPLEFITSSLIINKDKEEKTKALTEYARKNNIKIVLPRFRYARADYFMNKDENVIYKGISSIKFMNANVAEELYSLRNNKYESFVDLLIDINNETSLNSRQLDILVKIGFFEEFGGINDLLNSIEIYNYWKGKNAASIGKKTIKKAEISKLNIPIEEIEMYLSDKTKNGVSKTQYKVLDWIAVAKAIINHAKHLTTTMFDIVKYQVECLGYIDYTDEKLAKNVVAISDLDTTYSIKCNATSLNSGQVCEVRVAKRKNKKDKIETTWNDVPFENGDILVVDKFVKKSKMKKDGENWVTVPNEYYWYLGSYHTYKSKECDAIA